MGGRDGDRDSAAHHFANAERRVEISTLRCICIAKIRGGQFVTSSAFANGSRVAE